MAAVNSQISGDWGSGFVAGFTLANDAGALTGWQVTFDAAIDITAIWGASILGHSGDHWVLGPAAWNASLGPGASTSFGFLAAGSSASLTHLVLDGAAPATPALPSLTLDDASAAEGSSAVVTLHLSAASATPVTLHYATADATALAGQDYTATSGDLTFAPGETSKAIAVPVLADALVEGTESFTLSLGAPSGRCWSR